MMLDEQSVFSFAKPAPDVALIRRVVILMAACVTFMAALILLTDVFPRVVVLGLYVIYVMLLGATVPFAALSVRRSRVVLEPDQLILKRWFETRRVDWQDVSSIEIGKFEAESPLVQLLRGDTKLPAVMIELKRGRFGLTIQGTKTIVLYLHDSQRFVDEARRHLAPDQAS